MFLSDENRTALQRTLLKTIPMMDDGETRRLFTLLLALLSDLEEALLARKSDAERHFRQIRSIEERLSKVLETAKPGDRVVQ